jgi:hypothetical protein
MSWSSFRDGLIAHYGEAFDRGVALVQLDFSAERIRLTLAECALLILVPKRMREVCAALGASTAN